MTQIKNILVANRGEIALRVIRTARALGYQTTSLYSTVDSEMPHAAAGDKAVCIGPGPATQSYLNIPNVIAAAKSAGADAIHPGYGFLSENPEFAEACAAAGIVFIGPTPDAMRAMADKATAKQLMKQRGVPCVPGYDGESQDFRSLKKEAATIGYPIMIKATAGGGGKGIRLVATPADLQNALELSRSEAEKAFGNGSLMLEKAIQKPRHVEVQVFADSHGNVIHLGDRDCSVQRRHQKVLEEAPAPGLSAELRDAMGAAAVEAARAVNYLGAGTVEFLVGQDGSFYFLEMNTRLQVEHPVTEMVTGQDLVEWQIMVASGGVLPLRQDEVTFAGHAIEARLYAEDPSVGFLPQSGVISAWTPPEGPSIRIDHGVCEGATISPYYDPMIAKVIAHGRNRNDARRKLARALTDCIVAPLPTNRTFLLDCLNHEDFVDARLSTDFIEKNDLARASPADADPSIIAIAAVLVRNKFAEETEDELRGWRNNPWDNEPLSVRVGDWSGVVHISNSGDAVNVSADGGRTEIKILRISANWARIRVNGVDEKIQVTASGVDLIIAARGRQVVASLFSGGAKERAGAQNNVSRAPMPGIVTSVRVKLGDPVKIGDVLFVMEAMKMEHLIVASMDGAIKSLNAEVGKQVAMNQILAEIGEAA